jgi:hypothetical protein
MPINQDLRTAACFHALQRTDLSTFIPHRKVPASNAWRPKIGDQTVTTVLLFDKHHTEVGTGAGVCTLISLEPPLGTLVQCLITAVFDNKGQIIFGGIVPPPDIGAVGHLGILGGTDDFRTARGEVTLVVISPTSQEGTYDIEVD